MFLGLLGQPINRFLLKIVNLRIIRDPLRNFSPYSNCLNLLKKILYKEKTSPTHLQLQGVCTIILKKMEARVIKNLFLHKNMFSSYSCHIISDKKES